VNAGKKKGPLNAATGLGATGPSGASPLAQPQADLLETFITALGEVEIGQGDGACFSTDC
jgi:hypothetical protein